MFARWAITLRDRLQFNPLVRRSLAQAYFALDHVDVGSDARSARRAIVRLAASSRLCHGSRLEVRVERRIRSRLARSVAPRAAWAALESGGADVRQIPKGVLLKPWRGGEERGVLLISFENQWIRLLGVDDLDELVRRYSLVLAPSWSPPHHVATCVFPTYLREPVFTLISNPRDMAILPRLSPRLRVVPLYASSWVNPAWFRPRPVAEKDLDVVMLANFARYKRHHVLFRALRTLPSSLRVRLIGHHLGDRTAETLHREARSFGVAGRYELLAHAPDDVVYDSLARARVSLILSRGEGSCVAVVESMFAGTPVGLLRGAEIGSAVFVNEHTGRFLDERRLAADLQGFVADAGRYDPRTWVAGRGISCFASTARLNDVLRAASGSDGRPWTEDIAPHHWRPNPELVHEADRERMRPAYEDLRRRFGLVVGKDR